MNTAKSLIIRPSNDFIAQIRETRRRTTMNSLLWGTISTVGIIFVVLFFIDLRNPYLIPREDQQPLLLACAIFIVIALGLVLLNRFVSTLTASIIFDLFCIFAICLSDTPQQVLQERSLLFFILPVVISSLLLHPWAGYGVAVLTSLASSYYAIVIHRGVPNFPALVFLFLIAFIIEQSTSNLDRVMEQEQKNSRALSESEDKYHRLIDLLPVGVLIHQNGKIVLINPAGARLFAAESQEELIGTTFIDHVHPDYREVVQARILAALTKGLNAGIIEEELLRTDGTPFYAEASGLPFSYGEQPSVLVVLTDITERKRARQAIDLQNQRIREVSLKLLEVQEQEKHLLATELHDDLGQSLTSLKLMLELSTRAHSSANWQKKMAEARELVSDLMNKVRNLSLDLRPAMLDDFGLFKALRWLFDRFEFRTGISVLCNDDLDGKQRFEPPVETAAFRIIQEALTNVARHASVKEAQVTISTGAVLHIEVVDQGAGFDVTKISPETTSSAGLSGMQERARLLGGLVEFHSKPGAGTRVVATIPLTGAVQ